MTVWWARLLSDRAEFLANPDAPGTFASVSAFASLHCGFTCMVVLMLRYYGLHRLAAVVAVYLAATMVATVYFGWHFVIDLPGGVLVAVLAVWLGRWTIYPTGHARTRERHRDDRGGSADCAGARRRGPAAAGRRGRGPLLRRPCFCRATSH
jgi:membrane-associated phospholipid phosphatase